MWPSLLLVDKAKGITSFDVIRQLRIHYSKTHNGAKAPKLGHAGTLDPLATGLMLVGVGSGTKGLSELIKLDKEYIADVLIGESRTTGDMEGVVTEERVVEVGEEGGADFFEEKIRATLRTLCGQLTLPVSAYSAIKVGGVPMYKRARQAELTGDTIINIPMRTMIVYEAELLKLTIGGGRAVAQIRFMVGSGTYVRSLAEELGRRLGYPACLKDLRRTQVGEYRIENAVSVTEI
ncbi:tRNA pseudouridine(55) synthase [Candidatus Kaiserbacteria bacterium]|nr:tRNA pseudouridine(55) synthase [Candidatus Kaiserbacteria bacterium]